MSRRCGGIGAKYGSLRRSDRSYVLEHAGSRKKIQDSKISTPKLGVARLGRGGSLLTRLLISQQVSRHLE
jgi:hypothetical protein